MDPDSRHVSLARSVSPDSATAESQIQADHADEPLSSGEESRFWKPKNFEEIELFHGSYRTHRFAKHFHRVPAIGVVERGAMSTYCRRGDHVLGKGTVLLLNAGEVHAPAPAGDLGWSFRMFYLEPSFLKAAFPERSAPTLRFKAPFVHDPSLANALFRLHAVMEHPASRLELQSAFGPVLLQLCDHYVENTLALETPKPDRASIEDAIEHLHTNYQRNLSIEDLAELSPFGPSHFLRVFRAVVGLTPHAYLLQVRIERARELLRSRASIAEVAASLGFVDQSHFTRSFKRVLGVTPSRFAMSSL